MSGIEEPGTPPELPEEYADTYRDAYLRALAENPIDEPDVLAESETEDEDDGAERWFTRVRIVILAIAVVLLIGAAFGLGRLFSKDDAPATSGAKKPAASATVPPVKIVKQSSPTRGASEPSQTSTSGADLGKAYAGNVTPVMIASAVASCTARPGVDSANKPVTYGVANTLDADATTAWRCEDRGVGQTLTFSLPAGTEVGEVGLIPGYAKTDPVSGTDRYAENNRITRVRWTLADGVEIEQRLSPVPADRELQAIRVPKTATGSVTLEILAVKRGPRNTTAISSVLVAATT